MVSRTSLKELMEAIASQMRVRGKRIEVRWNLELEWKWNCTRDTIWYSIHDWISDTHKL
jgi:hypothetical protein